MVSKRTGAGAMAAVINRMCGDSERSVDVSVGMRIWEESHCFHA
jgi:hypothetical protein